MQDFSSYVGKRVVVTGCYSGIGCATAARLIELGAVVHGLDLRPNALALASFAAIDLRDPRSITDGVDAIDGPIDALFNCAGIAPGPVPLDVMTINFVGTRALTERVLERMTAGGAIVNVASNGGAGWAARLPLLLEFVATASFDEAANWYAQRIDALPNAYSLSKEAIIVWTMTASSDLIRRGIRMNCTCPGAVQTPMLEEIERSTPPALIDIVAQPIGRRSSAEEQTGPLLFLNSEAASYVNGAVLPVDGGFIGARTTGKIDAPAEIGRR